MAQLPDTCKECKWSITIGEATYCYKHSPALSSHHDPKYLPAWMYPMVNGSGPACGEGER